MIGLTIGVPILIGLWFGWRGATDMPQTAAEFGVSVAWALAWAAAVIFLWTAVIVFSAQPMGMAQIAAEAWFGTLVSAAFWLPVLVIIYILRTIRLKRA